MRICFKKIITTGSALMLLAVLMLTGCGNKQFDAADYVGAMLDASYKGDYGAYTKQDIGKKKDARTMHEDNLNALVDAFSDGHAVRTRAVRGRGSNSGRQPFQC